MKNLTIFCSSKNNINQLYFDNIELFIKNLDVNKFIIVYGGGTTGLMGKVRETWLNKEGKIISVNLNKFIEPNIIDDHIYDNIIDRQKKLIELGDIYIILPGGYGTHYEALDVMTNNDINESSKYIFILNINNIFDSMIEQIEKLLKEGFITKNLKKIKVIIEKDPIILSKIINEYNI